MDDLGLFPYKLVMVNETFIGTKRFSMRPHQQCDGLFSIDSMRLIRKTFVLWLVMSSFHLSGCFSFGVVDADTASEVDRIIRPMMREHNIPGMAVGIVHNGRISTYEYGFASKEENSKVTKRTLFEIGSVTKTFTGALAAYAVVKKQITLADKVSSHYPSLRGSPFDKVSLMNLATYTSGGLPLQTPGTVVNEASLMDYFRKWESSYEPGTHRVYSNPSIALLGRIAAKAMGSSFGEALEEKIFEKLEMDHSYLSVPKSEMQNYAWGYRKDKAIRMSPGVLASQAYGIRTTAEDLAKFIRANIEGVKSNTELGTALDQMKTGYYQIGPMTQNLVWEKYPFPSKLSDLLEGNSKKVIFKPFPVQKVNPEIKSDQKYLYNKTGSTNGFGAYVLFVPEKRIGVVLLANKNYPIKARISAAYQILASLVRK